MIKKVLPAVSLKGEARLPGDKSVSHRALILGAIAKGETRVHGFLTSQDSLATEACLKALGVEIHSPDETTRIIYGKGFDGLFEPATVLDANNSGTTIRLLLGLLAGRKFFSVLTGDDSLRQRPLARVVEPLRMMGAGILGRKEGSLAPVAVSGGSLRGITYRIPVASAQVKSALILAALQAEGESVFEEVLPTRDHTERLLAFMECPLKTEGKTIFVGHIRELKGKEIFVPGDFSSAAFLIVAGLCARNSRMRLNGVGLNPTRTALLDVLRRMGGDIAIERSNDLLSHEPEGDLIISQSKLKAADIQPFEVPGLIDELPIFAVAATQAEGVSTVRGAGELRVKESDRIKILCLELKKMGASIRELPDGFVIEGPCALRGARLESHHDHRLAMALAVAGLLAVGETQITGAETVRVSFPNFFETLEKFAE